MPRPRKFRKVCCLPQSTVFGPASQGNVDGETITMTVVEYETIRLIDYEQMSQVECAMSMNVARTTVQRIYSDARKKLADAIVNCKVISIVGGDYELYNEVERTRGYGRCRRHRYGQSNSFDNK